MRLFSSICFLCIFALVASETYFEEKFKDDSWQNNWIQSEHKDVTYGKFKWSAGQFFHDEEENKGIQTSQDAHFYALSTKFKPFSNKDKTLVVQFSVKHEQSIDCGGGYLKVFNCQLDPKDMHGETPYEIMFGPDICGPGTKKVHVIFSYKGKNHLIKKDIQCESDTYTHFYTLIVKADNTYQVLIDNKVVESGELETDWDFLPPKMIKDPSKSKPDDWDDNVTITDPEDEKPEDWVDVKHIPDPDAKKPEDWDDEMDGEWEPPMVDNPEYKGEWKPKQIDNPNYKGPWVHPEIENPEYTPDTELYKRDEICAVGFDLWQVKSGTIFDNVLFTDDPKVASDIVEKIGKPTLEAEKKLKAAADESEMKKSETTETPDEEDADDEDNAIPDPEEHDEL